MGLFDWFSGDAQKNAAQARENGINQGRSDAYGFIDAGTDKFNDLYGQAGSLYAGLAPLAGKRAGAYDDATGVNGAEGIARAKTAFTSMPGYTEGITMATDQNDRLANARGMLSSGNTIADTVKLATDYASQKYGDYVGSLKPYVGADTAVTGAQAGLLTKQGDQAFSAGALKGGIGYQAGQAIGNAKADAEMADYNASGNLWNSIMGAGKLAASIWGGA